MSTLEYVHATLRAQIDNREAIDELLLQSQALVTLAAQADLTNFSEVTLESFFLALQRLVTQAVEVNASALSGLLKLG